MLHEVLVALSGYSGDLFVPKKSIKSTVECVKDAKSQQDAQNASPDEGVEVAEEIWVIPEDWKSIHDSERVALEDIVQLGCMYSQIRRLVSSTHPLPTPTDQSAGGGSFLHALYSSVSHILTEYTGTIVLVEQKLLNTVDKDTSGVNTSISLIHHMFIKYKIILPEILRLLQTISLSPKQYHGTRLLDLLFSRSKSGVPQVAQTFKRLHSDLTRILYKHLTSWIFYGYLYDPHQEFFIAKKSNSDPVDSSSSTILQSNKPKWETDFYLREDYIPSYISKSIAKDILFIGKALATLKDSKKSKGVSDKVIKEQLHQLSLTLGETENSEFEWNSLQFDRFITRWKKAVGKTLWAEVVVGEDFMFNLKAFKSIYLLGRGEFFLDFIHEVNACELKARQRLTKITAHDLNAAFRKVGRKFADGVQLENEILERFTFSFEGKDGCDVFDIASKVFLNYEIKWPLDLVFTNEDIDRYNIIFKFLLKLRRAHSRLHRSWLLVNMGNTKQSKLSNSFIRDFVRIRNLMIHFFDNLWSYVQMDVLDSSFNSFLLELEAIDDEDQSDPIITEQVESQRSSSSSISSSKPKNFESIRRLHSEFLSNVATGLFVDDSLGSLDVQNRIFESIQLCHDFCTLVEKTFDKVASFSMLPLATGSMDPIEMGQRFQTINSHLFKIFSSVYGNHKNAKRLEQLLTRLDFNHFFSLVLL